MPSNVSGSECGGIGCCGHPRRRPITRTAASAAIPALMCTTVPPAKSSAPRRNSQPAGENTQCATGVYTTIAQSPRNQTHAENFMRSAIAPVISAGVMIANISWNAENDSGGIDSVPKPGRRDVFATSCIHARSKLPIHLPVPRNASEYTHAAQSTLDEAHAEEVLHEHAEHVLGPHHAAVEQRQPRRHEHARARRTPAPTRCRRR